MAETMEKIIVYYEDTDASGRVYYVNYLKYMERARSEFLYKLKLNHKNLKEKYNITFVVRNCNINFKKPAYFEDVLNIKTQILEFSKIKIIFNQIIIRNNDIITQGEITVVPVDSEGKINYMPENILKLF